MAATLERPTEVAEHDPHDDHEHAHPSDTTYWMVGAFLAAVTVAEILAAEMLEGFVAGALLILMMIVKFGVVVAMFMHLRFDSKILRFMFLIGLVMAIAVYAATAGAMSFWDNSGVDVISDVPADQPLPPEPTLPAPIIRESGGH